MVHTCIKFLMYLCISKLYPSTSHLSHSSRNSRAIIKFLLLQGRIINKMAASVSSKAIRLTAPAAFDSHLDQRQDPRHAFPDPSQFVVVDYHNKTSSGKNYDLAPAVRLAEDLRWGRTPSSSSSHARSFVPQQLLPERRPEVDYSSRGGGSASSNYTPDFSSTHHDPGSPVEVGDATPSSSGGFFLPGSADPVQHRIEHWMRIEQLLLADQMRRSGARPEDDPGAEDLLFYGDRAKVAEKARRSAVANTALQRYGLYSPLFQRLFADDHDFFRRLEEGEQQAAEGDAALQETSNKSKVSSTRAGREEEKGESSSSSSSNYGEGLDTLQTLLPPDKLAQVVSLSLDLWLPMLRKIWFENVHRVTTTGKVQSNSRDGYQLGTPGADEKKSASQQPRELKSQASSRATSESSSFLDAQSLLTEESREYQMCESGQSEVSSEGSDVELVDDDKCWSWDARLGWVPDRDKLKPDYHLSRQTEK
ncbi:unnamed protein product [Amoebophrya sp. A25]|nr:unnamed protein product [Amoebophrya sp. A25]|eukprot:GSA25T00001933001.1